MTAAAISEIVIKTRSEGVERATAAIDKLVSSEEALVRVTDQTNKSRERNATAIDRIARRYDAEYKAAQDVARATSQLNRARDAGLAGTVAYERALAAVQKQQALVSRNGNDNAKATGLASHELLNLSRQAQDVAVSLAGGQSPLTVLMQQGSQVVDVLQSHRGGVGGAVKALGVSLAEMVTPARALGVGTVASFAAIEAAASKATSALADLGNASAKTGLSPSTIQGAQIVGARAGLDRDATRQALESANSAFEQFRRNSGGIVEMISKVDKGFLSVADRAKTAGEFIDRISEEIRKLPREEGLDLAQKLFGQDAGQKLFESIRNGSLSMATLADAAGSAGKATDQLARNAAEAQKAIDAAAETASAKLLVAFQALGNPVDDIKLGWYSIVGSIADAVTKSQTLQSVMQGFLHPIDTIRGLPKTVSSLFAEEAQFRGRLVPVEDQFDTAKSAFFRAGPQIESATAGASRARFAAFNEKDKGGKSDAEREAENYTKITRELENQLRLAQTIGNAHDAVSLQIKIENEQLKLGATASEEHKNHVADLVTRIDEATRAQERLTESAKATNQAYASVSNTLAGGIKDILLKGGKPGDVLKGITENLQGSFFDAALTGSGPFASMFGLSGKDGATGGLFGSIGSLLGIGGGKMDLATMNVGKVNIAGGGLDSALGAAGGLLGGGGGGGLLGGLGIGGGGGGGGGLLGGLLGLGSKLLGGFGLFAEGGIVGASRAPMGLAPISAFIGAPHFAAGGAVGGGGAVPIIAHAGELVLNAAQQHRVAAAIGGGQQQAPTVNVNISGAPQGTTVQESRDASGNRRIDVMLDEAVAKGIGSPRGQEALRTSGMVVRR